MSAQRGVPLGVTDPAAEAGLTLLVLGRVELVAANGTQVLGPGKPLALLAYLQVQPMHSATRPHLIDLLWSDLEPERARANLRQALLVLRRVLPPDTLVSDGDMVVLRGGVAVDRDAFITSVDRGDLEAAIAAYRGAFVPDLAVPGGAEFELWCEIERRHLGALFARVLETAARAALAAGRAAEALRLARRLRDLDASRERSWRLLIEAEVAAEGLASARLEADRLAEHLRSEHRPPEPATALLFQRVREIARPAAAGVGGLATPEFVGRETQLARVLAAWSAAKRGRLHHLHVEALAGTGKTRLLEETAARLHAAGACVVRCGARRDERGVPYALAASLVTSLATLPGSVAVAPASMSALVAMAPDASQVFTAPVDASTGDEAMRRRVVALADLLGAVTHESAVALAIDDTHWADHESLRVLTLALGRVSSDERLLVLSAGRDALPGASRAERVTLPPLTSAQVDAMLQSLGGAGDAEWWATFVAALRDAADGIAFHVLQLLRAVEEKQLLLLDQEVWIAPNVPALLAGLNADEAAKLRIAQLAVGTRAVLRVLCFGEVPDVRVVAAAVGADPAAVEADLGMLEVRGYVHRRVNGSWTVVHDEMSELVLAQSDAPSLNAARLGLARALAALPSATVAMMRRIVALLIEAGADAEVPDVVRSWVRSGACPRRGVRTADLLPPGLADARAEQLRRRVQRTLPRERDHRPHAVAALFVVALIALWSWVTRPSGLVLVQAPVYANDFQVADQPAVVGVVDRLGRRLRHEELTVHVRRTAGGVMTGRTAVPMRGGIATFDSLLTRKTALVPFDLIFEADHLQPVRVHVPAEQSFELRLRTGTINGTRLEGAVPRVHVAPGARIAGDIIFDYSSSFATATVFFGSIATWMPRESDTASIRSLLTPVVHGNAQARVDRIAPTKPGRYLLVFAIGAEPRAAYLFSSSNWTCGAPRWHDGDDLQDVPVDELLASARAGARLRPVVKCVDGRSPTKPWRNEALIGLSAVEVLVNDR